MVLLSHDPVLIMFRPLSMKKQSNSKVHQRWNLFHATDFQSLMYPCFTFCRIIGIFPYKINASIFVASKVRYFLSTVVFLIVCSYGIVLLYQMDISGTLEQNGVPASLQSNCYIILGGVIAIVTYIMTGQRMRLLQELQEISSRLPPESYRKLSWLIHAKDIFGFFFLLCQTPNVYSSNVYETLMKLYMLYITMLVFQIDMLYMNCVCVLKVCFKRINDNLRNLRELVMNDEPHLLRRTYHEQRNPFLLFELKALKKRHLIVSDTVQMLNSTFSLQLLATVVLTFGEVTFSLYFYILEWQGVQAMDPDRRIWYSYFTMSIAYYSVKMALIVWACETGKDQAVEIGTTVHDVLISTNDKQIKDEVAKR